MKYIFVDCNIFIHFKFFEEIPWKDLVDSHFTLLVAPITILELDKLKNNSNPKKSKRAKAVIKRIKDIVANPTLYPLLYLLNRPTNDKVRELQLDPQQQDDLLLATIIEYKNNNSSHDVYLVSDDTGVILKAPSLGINILDLSEQYLQPEEKDEDQLKIEQLRKEISLLKSAQPKLKLSFKNGEQLLTAKITDFSESLENYLERCFEEEVEKLQYLEFKTFYDYVDPLDDVENRKAGLAKWSQEFNSPSEDQVKAYNAALNEYYVNFREYIELRYEFRKTACLSFPIELELHNEGTAPATDIDLWLHFPDGFQLIKLDDAPVNPRKPEPPYRPQNRWDFRMPNFNIPGPPNIDFLKNSDFDNGIQIRETNSFEVDVHYNKLKHHHYHEIDKMLVIFGSVENSSGFTIDYKLHVGNLPDPVEGKLQVKVERAVTS